MSYTTTMHRRDITDAQVFRSFAKAEEWELGHPIKDLEEQGVPYKVALRKVEQMVNRGLFDYGVSINYVWLTEQGAELMRSGKA